MAVKYQPLTLPLIGAFSGTQTFDIATDKAYPYLIGIGLSTSSIVADANPAKSLLFSFRSSFGNIISEVPLKVFGNSWGTVPKNEMFFALSEDAGGRIYTVVLRSPDVITKVLPMQVILLLSDTKPAKNEKLDFLWKRFNLKGLRNRETKVFELDKTCKKIVGFGVDCYGYESYESVFLGVSDSNRVYLDKISFDVLSYSVPALSVKDKLLPIEIDVKENNDLKINIDSADISEDRYLDVVFLIEKK